jgi:hypothetical protein
VRSAEFRALEALEALHKALDREERIQPSPTGDAEGEQCTRGSAAHNKATSSESLPRLWSSPTIPLSAHRCQRRPRQGDALPTNAPIAGPSAPIADRTGCGVTEPRLDGGKHAVPRHRVLEPRRRLLHPAPCLTAVGRAAPSLAPSDRATDCSAVAAPSSRDSSSHSSSLPSEVLAFEADPRDLMAWARGAALTQRLELPARGCSRGFRPTRPRGNLRSGTRRERGD